MAGYACRKVANKLECEKASRLIVRQWRMYRAHRKILILKTRVVAKVVWKNFKQVQVREFMHILSSENLILQDAIVKIQAKLRQC